MRIIRIGQKPTTLRCNNEKGFITYLFERTLFLKEHIVLYLKDAGVDMTGSVIINKFYICPHTAKWHAKITTFVKQIVDAVKNV